MAKKLTGCSWIFYIYDHADRLIFSQDGQQRKRGEWLFTIPDAFGRTCLTGICKNTYNVLASNSPLSVVVSTGRDHTNSTYKGYTNPNITLTSAQLLIVNYYDDYNFLAKTTIPEFNDLSFTYSSQSGFAALRPSDYKSLLTGTLTAKLDDASTPSCLAYAMYYDYRGRAIQKISNNHWGGFEKIYTAYNFRGQPAQEEYVHSATGKTTQTESYFYTYDHAERLTKVEHQLQTGTALNGKVTLVEYVYDELGRMQTKKQHGSTANPITYTYNVRGWTTDITSNRFTQNLYYNTGYGAPHYNGNISSMTWKAGTESTLRGYKFSYDGLARLTQAAYGEGTAISTNTDRFTEKVTGYDKHGNITALQRYGKTSTSAYGLIDNLTFGYTGNQMKYVNDAIPASGVYQNFHFADRVNSTADEYLYDANGNMAKDLNKNITGIQYNLLNLPKKVQLSSGGIATYLYDAAGVKRNVTHQGADVSKSTDYCGNVIYENGVLSKILTEEGYITLSGTTPTYHYYLNDHLGNNRVVLNQNGSTVEQVNHYYPFGGLFDQTSEEVQAHKFGGKELDRTYGIDLYDYARCF